MSDEQKKSGDTSAGDKSSVHGNDANKPDGTKAPNILWQLNPIRWFYYLEPIEKFTAVLCVVGALQFWAFIQSERAFIVSTSASFADWPLVPGHKPLELVVKFKNIGRSVATFDELSVVTADGLPATPNFEQGHRVTIGPLAPGASQTVRAYFGEGIGPQFIPDITGGKKEFYFFGRALYWDEYSVGIFGPKATVFCFRYRPGSSRNLDTCRVGGPYAYND